jgi:serine/threonine protein kinase
MSASADCAVLDRWETLLDAALPEDQRERYERHLESCGTCQARLDQAETGGGALVALARQLGDPTLAPTDAALSHALDRLHDVKSPLRAFTVEPADLYFLRPADEPGLLGMLGNYEVQEVIGQGGMGIVLLAFERALHRLVAIKVMAAAVAGSATARRRFTREAQAAAAVCHDHIVTVHGVHEENGLPYLVMQYVPGESLQARLDRTGPLDLMEIIRIGLQTASGLAAAHAQGLIHRDIKPANLLLENGLARVKITDFGLARTVDDVGLTQDGVVAGTPEFMAPEQARGETVDHRADLFSLGSVLYAMCTGVPPFRGASAVAVLRQVSDQEPTPIRALNPDVPAWLETLVERLMAKAPGDRFQSAAEVAELLEGYLAHLRQPMTFPAPELPSTATLEICAPEEAQPTITRRRSRLLSWPSGLAICLLAAAASAGFLLSQNTFREKKSLPAANSNAAVHVNWIEEMESANRPAAPMDEQDDSQPADRDRALATLEKIGARLKRDVPSGKIIEVDLSGTAVTDSELRELAPLKAVQVLNLKRTAVSDAGLKQIASLRNLRRLELANTQVTGTGLAELAPLKRLDTLRLERTPITDDGLTGLLALPGLGSLSLEGTAVSDAGMKTIGKLTQLAALNLGQTKITDAGLKELAGLTRLGWLGLYYTAVTDAGMKEVAKLGQLDNLHLTGTAVTDAGVKELAALKRLRQVHIGDTVISEKGIKELQAAVPPVAINTVVDGSGQAGSKRHLATILIAGLVVTLVGAGGIWVYLRRSRRAGKSPAKSGGRFGWLFPALLAVLVLAALGIGVTFWPTGDATAGQAGADRAGSAAPEMKVRIQHDFRTADWSNFVLRPMGDKVAWEAGGVRVTLPAGQGVQKPAGLGGRLTIKGDFEITVSYEILEVDKPSKGYGVGVALYVAIDPDSNDAVSLARRLLPDGRTVFMSDRMKPGDGKLEHKTEMRPSSAETGKLRIQRAGSRVRFLVAEEDSAEFTQVDDLEFGAGNVTFVQVSGNGGGSESGLDIRLLDFTLRTADPAASATVPSLSGGKEGLVWVLTFGLLITLALAVVGLYLRRRHRARLGLAPMPTPAEPAKPALAAATISMPCPGCGKNLRARAEFAGKKCKCPQCGQAVLVPATPSASPAAAKERKGLSIAALWLLIGAIVLVPPGVLGAWYFQNRQPADRSSLVNVTLGNEFHSQVDEEGFYYQERDKDGLPFRWTDGKAKLGIPIDRENPPQALEIELHVFRPRGVAGRVQIKVNERELAHEDIRNWQWTRTFNLAGIDLGEVVSVEINSDTFVPFGVMDKGANTDPRALGVQVWNVKLLPALEKPAQQSAISNSATIEHGHEPAMAGGGITANGKTLVTGGIDGTIKLWDLATSRERKQFQRLVPGLLLLAVSPQGDTFATQGSDRLVRVWRMETGEPLWQLSGFQSFITFLAYSPDGRILGAVGGQRMKAGELRLWDTATGQERGPFEGFKSMLWGLAFSPDGKNFVVGGGDGQAQVVALDQSKRTGYSFALYAHGLAFSPDGALLAVGFGDAGQVQIQEANSDRPRSSFQSPRKKYAGRLEFSSEGQLLLAPCIDDAVLLWDVSEPQSRLVAVLDGHQAPVRFATFLPDGQSIATGDDRSLRLWRIAGLEPAPATMEAPKPNSASANPWIIAVMIGWVLASSSAFAAWLYLRPPRRNAKMMSRASAIDPRVPPNATAASVLFACPGCGKSLKAKATLAGQKIKCPGCGAAALVPAQEPVPSGPASA